MPENRFVCQNTNTFAVNYLERFYPLLISLLKKIIIGA